MSKTTRSPAELRNMFGANLRVLSQEYTSISELCRQLVINRTQFNRYLSGESFPRPDVLDRICEFFNVDARILLEPVMELGRAEDVLNGPILADFVGVGLNAIPEDVFPSGFYRFARRSFLDNTIFATGLVYAFRSDDICYVRGYEPKEAMRQQGLATESAAREWRGYATRQEDGIALIISRRNAMTCSFNYLSRVASFENNHWVGYVTRTVRESPTENRVTRMVYEHLGREAGPAFEAARGAGFCSEEELLPYHRRLLQPDEPFR